MKILKNEPLAPYTSLHCGGPAKELVIAATYDEVVSTIERALDEKKPLWFLGFGSNSLISDGGLSGITLVWHGGTIEFNGSTVTADAGVWWDSLVQASILAHLWGLELMSEIPSSVGGAVVGNIAAYGQQISDTLQSVTVFNTDHDRIEELSAEKIKFSYRRSSLQSHPELLILRATFTLSTTPTHELRYASALDVATSIQADIDTLEGRRNTIIETRTRAGSIYHPEEGKQEYTAGSFFKNPLVSAEIAEKVARFDESGKALERVLEQNRIHGGSTQRASAAHVLLAAGFERGQQWGEVRLHPDHVLKIENLGQAKAQDVYDVAHHIIKTVEEKLGITLEPEVRFLGSFNPLQTTVLQLLPESIQ